MTNLLGIKPTIIESAADIKARFERINKLIEDRKFETADRWESMEDILDRREIDITFGSTSYEYRLPRNNGGYNRGLSQVNDRGDLDTVFLHGYCPLFAFAAHERTGLDFRLFSSPRPLYGSWAGHVGLDLGDGKFLDVTGRRTVGGYNAQYPTFSTEVINREQFLSLLVDPEHRDNPLMFVEELEQLLTQQTAHEVLVSESLI